MLKSIKLKKINIHKLLKEDLYIKKESPLKKLLGVNKSRNIRMKIYRKLNFIASKKAVIDKEYSYKKGKNSSNIEYKKENFKELNESLINLFHKANYSYNNAKKNFEQKKEVSDIFSKSLKDIKKFEKDKMRMYIKRNNSAIKFNQSFSIFNEVVNKYKERGGFLYTKDLFKRDIYQETPIVTKKRDKIKNYYIYNYDKYVKKTNLSNIEIPKRKKEIKNKSISNDIKKINFDKLIITSFYKKLFIYLQKKILQLKGRKVNHKRFKYDFKYLKYKEEQKNKSEILKLKKEIKNLKSLFASMQEIKNINNKLSDNYKLSNKTFNKKYQIDSFRNIKLLSPISAKNIENKFKNKVKKLFNQRALSNTSKNFFIRNNYKEGNSLISQKTKTTIYSAKAKNNKTFPLTPRNEIKNLMDLNNEELKDTKDAYEELKLKSLDNKNLIFDKIEQYLENKGYNVERIKNSINKEQLFNFFDAIKKIVSNYNCKSNVNELYSHTGEKLSKNTFMNLNKINQMDKIISSVENDLYLSLIKK